MSTRYAGMGPENGARFAAAFYTLYNNFPELFGSNTERSIVPILRDLYNRPEDSEFAENITKLVTKVIAAIGGIALTTYIGRQLRVSWSGLASNRPPMTTLAGLIPLTIETHTIGFLTALGSMDVASKLSEAIYPILSRVSSSVSSRGSSVILDAYTSIVGWLNYHNFINRD